MDIPRIYYHPDDLEIDTIPHPVWKRMRDEMPLYYNASDGFYALSRFEDVEAAISDMGTYLSGHGSTLEVVQSGIAPLPGNILMEDPPIHDIHRGLLSRVFTPRRMNALEDKVRQFCAVSLDPLVGSDGFDFIADLGAQMPMRTIGMLLGIPESDQAAIRDAFDEGMSISDGETRPAPSPDEMMGMAVQMFSSYIEWRADNPSDDLMTALLTAEFEDESGTTRTLRRDEVFMFVLLLAGAGNETTTRLIGWTGKLLSDHPDQRNLLVQDRSLVPSAIEEILRYEAPSPVQARVLSRDVQHYGQVVPAGSAILLLNGSANRDERHFPDGDRFDILRPASQHLSFGRGGHFCLGASLARLEGRVALEEVLARFPDWEVDWSNARQAHTKTVRGWEKLPVLV